MRCLSWMWAMQNRVWAEMSQSVKGIKQEICNHNLILWVLIRIPCVSRKNNHNISFQYGHSLYPVGDIEPSTQSTIPSGCYSTHILLFEGTTIVRLEDAHQNTPSEKTDLSDIQSMHIRESSSNVSQLWPTFNCAFATMVHGLEKIKKYKTIGIPQNTLKKKSVLILVKK